MTKKIFGSILFTLFAFFIFANSIVYGADVYAISAEDFATELKDIYDIQIDGTDFVPISMNGTPESFEDYILSGSIDLQGDETGGNISIDQALIRNDYDNYIYVYRITSTPFSNYINNIAMVEVDILNTNYSILDYEPKNIPGSGTETKNFGLKAGISNGMPDAGISVGSSISGVDWSEIKISNESKITGEGEKGTFKTSFVMNPHELFPKYDKISPFLKRQVLLYGMFKFSCPTTPRLKINFGGRFSQTGIFDDGTIYDTTSLDSDCFTNDNPVEKQQEVTPENFRDYVAEFYQIEINQNEFTPISLTGRIETLEDYVLTDTVIVKHESGRMRGRFTINQIMIRTHLGRYIYAYRIVSTPYTIPAKSDIPMSERGVGLNGKASVKVNILTDNYTVLKSEPRNKPQSGVLTQGYDINLGLTEANIEYGFTMTTNWEDLNIDNQSEVAYGNEPGKMHIDHNFRKPKPLDSWYFLRNETWNYGMFKFSSESLPLLEIEYGGEIRKPDALGWDSVSNYKTINYDGCLRHIYDNSNACKICGEVAIIEESLTIHCRTNDKIKRMNLAPAGELLYKINIGCSGYYRIETFSDYGSAIEFYDHNMSRIKINNVRNQDFFGLVMVEPGIYYLKIDNMSYTKPNYITLTLDSRINDIQRIYEGETVDALKHLHDNQNVFTFTASKTGFFDFTLNAIGKNTPTYPEGSITITDQLGNLVQKYDFPEYNNYSTSLKNAKNIIIFAEQYETYYININYKQQEISELTLSTNYLKKNKLDSNDHFSSYSNLITGDKIEIVEVQRTGKYSISVNYFGDQQGNMKLVFFKKIGDDNFIELDKYIVNEIESYYHMDILLNSWENLYVGYFNSEGNGTISLDISRNISNEFSLVTDLNSNVTVGSEVTLNNGAYNGRTLTQGYTRVCYLGMDAPDLKSRTYYNWYSTDSTVAIVSSFGTVTATATWSDDAPSKNVTIIAVYKDNPTIIGEIELTVYKDTSNSIVSLQYGMDVRESGTEYGTEVSSGLGNPIKVGNSPSVTIHRSYTRLICIGNDSPTASIQDYDWSVDRQIGETGNVTVSQFGTITGIKNGTVTIKGTYKYNPRFIVSITIIVKS